MIQYLCITKLLVVFALFGPSFQQSNLPPTFTVDLNDILVKQGINEDVKPGIVIGRLSCTDPDGDRVFYFKSNSNSFTVDLNGTVVLAQQLDRESSVNTANPSAKPNSVRFECVDYYPSDYSVPYLRDRPRRQERTTSDLDVTVIDANDNPMLFSIDLPGGFSFQVNENVTFNNSVNATDKNIIGKITLTDADLGTNANLYSLKIICEPTDPEPCQKFGLRPAVQEREGVYTTNLFVNGSLDYETRTEYRTKLEVTDGIATGVQLTTVQGIRIEILDSQDTIPYFTNQNYNFDVYEGTPNNTLVNFSISAIDGDKGAQRVIHLEILRDQYNLLSADPAIKASDVIKGYESQLRIAALIDRETLPAGYVFVAKATELDGSGNRTNTSVVANFTMNILDINDNYPVFRNMLYTVTLPEIQQEYNGTQIPGLDIEVTDADEPLSAKFRLEIVSQTFSGAFGFTPNAEVTRVGHFYLIANSIQYLDYDADPSYRNQTVVVRVVEQLPGGQTRVGPSGTATVTIILTDVNDNFPIFSPSDYSGAIIENANRFTSILTVSAKDKDSGRNGEVRYRLENRVNNIFAIDTTTGVITLVGGLDYWNQSVYSFQVFAYDMADDRKEAAGSVTITVSDYNNEKPVFALPVYSATVTEFETRFQSPVVVQARDERNGSSIITYSIFSGNTPTNKFVVNRTSGELTLREGLDFEETVNKTGYITLVIAASDNGSPPQTSTCLVTVTVVDLNNFSPVFNPTVYSATVSEAVPPGTYVTTVSATDRDFGTNGQVSYRIGTGSRDNCVVYNNGSVYISNFPTFDYDQYTSLTVQIIAIDGGSPQKSSTATLIINVTDANNKPPRFDQAFYSTVINESAPVGTSVLRVNASDIDTQHLVRYYINRNSIIAISKSGIRTESTLQYDFRNSFSVDPASGMIRVAQTLNRNYVIEMSFDVEARDEHPSAVGIQTATSRVQITISGLPNRELYFLQPWTKENPTYTIPILETAPIGFTILTLIARDPIDQSTVTVYNKILESDRFQAFILGFNGTLLLNKALNYESGDRSFSTVVQAIKTDTGGFMRTVSATCSILVQDFNDNAPRFTRDLYTFTVPETLTINSLIGEARAVDADSSSFGSISFSLGGGLGREDIKLFQTADEVGVVQILVGASQLDYETRTEYVLELIATDNANNAGSQIQMTGTTTVRIYVTDDNDNSPIFADQSRSFSVPETANIQTRLGQIEAVDRDSGVNGQITYTLDLDPGASTPTNALALFRITDTGILVTRASLRGLSGGYSLLVVARDGGFPQRSASIPVLIKVQGAEDDDGTPQWLQPYNNFVVYVTEHNRTKLDVRFTATARTPNASVVFSFNNLYRPEDAAKFFINATAGDIYVTADLDREIQEEYSLIVQATDTINRTLVSQRTLYVRLIDINDNLPSFRSASYRACPRNFSVPTTYYVWDKTAAGTIVGRAEACDPDGSGNNIITYSIYDGNTICKQPYSGNFTVHANGSIETKVVLSYEVRSEYLVCVKLDQQQYNTRRKRAFDRAQMMDTDKVAYIVIAINDLNDNGPKFPNMINTAVVETVPADSFVAQVTADDADGPLYSQIKYDIVNTLYYPPGGGRPYAMLGSFAINPDSGVVTADRLTYEDFAQGHFVLTVAAYDYNNQAYRDYMNMTVVVYQRSQVLRIVLNKVPSEGIILAPQLIAKLNAAGAPNRRFFYLSASEHRSASGAKETQTDICFVMVDNSLNQAYDAGKGITTLSDFGVVFAGDYSLVDRGTCYQMRSSEQNVRWRDLWWVLVAIALFMFVCLVILLITIYILYDRYKSYYNTHKTYLVPQ